jgi:hypothetical protein
MGWVDRETDWLLTGHHVYFAPEDESGISEFERHLRARRLGFVIHNRRDVPAVVFAPRRRRSGAAGRAAKPAPGSRTLQGSTS